MDTEISGDDLENVGIVEEQSFSSTAGRKKKSMVATSITRDILNRFEEVDILNEDYEVSVLSLVLKQLGLFNKMKTSMTKKKEKRLQHILTSRETQT